MVRFYENWLGARDGKPLSKAEALKEAKQWLRNLTRKEVEERIANLPEAARGLKLEPAAQPQAASEKPFAHPYYWSAFILIGDPQ
jgi:CHAT domain-containing protein